MGPAPRLLRPPRNGTGGPEGNRTLIPWVQARDPPVERRAHPAARHADRTPLLRADNAASTATGLYPPQDGPSPRIRTATDEVLSVVPLPVGLPRNGTMVSPDGLEPPPQ